jgi:hypothetical protein
MVDTAYGFHADGEGPVFGVEGYYYGGFFGAVGDEWGDQFVGAFGVFDACPVVEGCGVEFSGEVDVPGEGVVGVFVALVVGGCGWHGVPCLVSGRLVPGRCGHFMGRSCAVSRVCERSEARLGGPGLAPRHRRGAVLGVVNVSDCSFVVGVRVAVYEVCGIALDVI